MAANRFEYLRGDRSPGQPAQPRRERTLQERLADQYRPSTPERRAIPLSDGHGRVIGGTGGSGRDAMPFEISAVLETGIHQPGDAPSQSRPFAEVEPSYRILAKGRVDQQAQEFSDTRQLDEVEGIQSIVKRQIRGRTQEILDGTRTGNIRSPKHPKGERRDKGGRPRGSRR